MMGVRHWKRPVCACMPASSRSTIRSSGCRKKKLAPITCQQLHQLLVKGLQAMTCLWPPLQHAYEFVHQAAHILANHEQETGAQVRERYLRYVAQMHEQKAALGPLAEAMEHF